MPAKSIQQFKLFKGISEGSIKKKGMSREMAKEYIGHQSPKGLPNKIKKKKGKPKLFDNVLG